MPNEGNIESPITLVGSPRSGTTLTSRIFQHHAGFSSVGETENLIFYSWHAVEASRDKTAPPIEDGVWVDDEQRARNVVRQTFLTCFPDDKPYWFQKPNGIPALFYKYEISQWSEAARWYWKVMRETFPKGRYFTVLRHPCDIVLSGRSLWGYDAAGMWWAIAFMANLLTHPDSLVEYAVHYEELVRDKEQSVRELFDYLGVPFDEQVLKAFDKVHVPSKGRDQLDKIGGTRQDEWVQLDPAKLHPSYQEHITRLFDKFGFELPWPQHFIEHHTTAKDRIHPHSSPSNDAKQVDSREHELRKEFDQKLTELHEHHRLERRKVVRDCYNEKAQLRRKIVELEKKKLIGSSGY